MDEKSLLRASPERKKRASMDANVRGHDLFSRKLMESGGGGASSGSDRTRQRLSLDDADLFSGRKSMEYKVRDSVEDDSLTKDVRGSPLHSSFKEGSIGSINDDSFNQMKRQAEIIAPVDNYVGVSSNDLSADNSATMINMAIHGETRRQTDENPNRNVLYNSNSPMKIENGETSHSFQETHDQLRQAEIQDGTTENQTYNLMNAPSLFKFGEMEQQQQQQPITNSNPEAILENDRVKSDELTSAYDTGNPSTMNQEGEVKPQQQQQQQEVANPIRHTINSRLISAPATQQSDEVHANENTPPTNSKPQIGNAKETNTPVEVLPVNSSLDTAVNSISINPPSVTFGNGEASLENQLDQTKPLDHLTNSSSENTSPGNREKGRPKKKKPRKKKSQRQKKQTPNVAIIEDDAAFAFSPYHPVPPLSFNEGTAGAEIDSQFTSTKQIIESIIQHPNGAILDTYSEKMNLVQDFYNNVPPFRMGKRNLPLDQLEVVLRRRAIKKREVVQATPVGSVEERSVKSDNSTTVATGRVSMKTPLVHSHIPRPPSRESQYTPRRTLFPNAHGHSRSQSLGMDTTFEDDSTISSATVASNWTTGYAITPTSVNNISIMQTLESSPINVTQQIMPREEIIGDTSLGLKLKLLYGKVIVHVIDSLRDGRASPAQLCGLICPGDVIIAVNGMSLIDGNKPIHPDQLRDALKPLSDPIHNDGRYCREVRLRFALGEGMKILRENLQIEQRRQRVMEERRKLGLDGKAGAASIDHAADIFGLSALMGVDQHTGMPLFQRQHLETHHDRDEVEVEESNDEIAIPELNDLHEFANHQLQSFFNKTPPLLQTKISRQIAIERAWIRKHNTSEYFTLDSEASVLLRAPLTPTVDQSAVTQLNPIEVRKQKLEIGAANMSHAKLIVSIVEKQDRGMDSEDEEEDPMEVASRVCGTASVRTGASRRRWHRDSVIAEDVQSSAAVSASSMDNQVDANTLVSGESVEVCDHRLLVDLAANNESWKRNVLKRLEEYATDTANKASSNESQNDTLEGNNEAASSSIDSLFFGRDVAKILKKKKSSLALPPGEMTQMLFDLKDHLEHGLPTQIFTNGDEFTTTTNNQEKSVTFVKSLIDNSADVFKATNFLVNEALAIWLKSFRPLPWKQRRALWPLYSLTNLNHETGSMMSSSHFDDGMSLSMASGGTHSTAKTEKRNLREIVEEMELDRETREETCGLVTFYFTQKYLQNRHNQLSRDEEDRALELIDEYGSYMDLHKTLVTAGKLQCQSMIVKLVSLAKFDPQHRESMKGLQKAKVLLFYEPNMLSALHELLLSRAYNRMSSNFDVTRLLVSAFPDLSPMSVKAASNDNSDGFYFSYLSLLMHPDEGSDHAKHDGSLVKEWCSMLCSFVESNDVKTKESIQSFYHVASASDEFSRLYHRDLPYLLELSIKMKQYELALDIANEILLSSSQVQDSSIMTSVVKHLRDICAIATSGDLDPQIFGRIISFYTAMSKSTINIEGFEIVTELKMILEQCVQNLNIDTCLVTVAEKSSPSNGLRVLSELKLPKAALSSRISSIHTSLTKGARESVSKEISGSLLRIQRVREERRCLDLERSMTIYNCDENEPTVDDNEAEGFIWPSILDGRVIITK